MEITNGTDGGPGELLPGEIHVWTVPLVGCGSALAKWGALLSESELKRAGAFRYPGDAALYVAAHGSLREILGAYAKIPPGDIEFGGTEFGKPLLRNNEHGIRFNMSHSAGGALVAVSRNREVGVDIEAVAPAGDLGLIAERCFSSREIDLFRSAADSGRTEVFYGIWTRKEAYIKARGEGMSMDLRAIDCSSLPAILDGRWHVMDLGHWNGCLCALATDGPVGRVSIIGSDVPGDAAGDDGAGYADRVYRRNIQGAGR